MVQIVLVGIGAGAAAALLFASVASGSLLAVVPVLSRAAADPDRGARLEPSGRPVARAVCAAIGARAGVSAAIFFVAFLVGVGLPAWWLGYLALLARPVAANGSAGGIEWYPVGRLVFWAAIIGALVIAVACARCSAPTRKLPGRLRMRSSACCDGSTAARQLPAGTDIRARDRYPGGRACRRRRRCC